MGGREGERERRRREEERGESSHALSNFRSFRYGFISLRIFKAKKRKFNLIRTRRSY